MRQLTVIAEMGSGGAESVVYQLAEAGVELGDDVVVATSGGWRVPELERLGVPVVGLPLADPGVRGVLRSAFELRRWLQNAEPIDVVHAHNVRATAVARLAMILGGARVPIVSTVHGLDASRYASAARLLTHAADVVVAVSDDVASRLRAAGLPEARLRVVPNAPPTLVLVEPASARRQLGLPGEGPVVLCVARLTRPKRHDLLVEAWSDAPSGAVLVLAGDGERRPALEEQTARLGLGDRVRFLGDRRDVGRLLSAADLLVLPSDHEGLPISVLEAMSAGVPVVASRVGGLVALGPDALLLVEPGSAAALGEGIARVLADSALADRLGERGRNLVTTSYGGATMAARYRDLLTSTKATRRRFTS